MNGQRELNKADVDMLINIVENQPLQNLAAARHAQGLIDRLRVFAAKYLSKELASDQST